MADILDDIGDWAAIRLAAIAELKRLVLFAATEPERRQLARRIEVAEAWTEGLPARGSRTIVVRSVEVKPDPDGPTQVGDEDPDHEVKITINGNRLITEADDRPFTVVLVVERGHVA